MSNNTCYLEHIPPRLHQNDRPTLHSFYIDEEIYRRSKREGIDCPFATITLADISINRQGDPRSPISDPRDVLYNITAKSGDDVPMYNQGYVVLKIKELLDDLTFCKRLEGMDKLGHMAVLEVKLKHMPVPCNYAHGIFELTYNGIKVTNDNYRETLKMCKTLRNDCRLIIHQMIIRREIRINSN